MGNWLRQNALGLILAAAAITGIYTKIQIDIAGNSAQISVNSTMVAEVSAHVKKTDLIVEKVPVLEERLYALQQDTIGLSDKLSLSKTASGSISSTKNLVSPTILAKIPQGSTFEAVIQVRRSGYSFSGSAGSGSGKVNMVGEMSALFYRDGGAFD